jgi:hypothetical protein
VGREDGAEESEKVDGRRRRVGAVRVGRGGYWKHDFLSESSREIERDVRRIM